MDSKNKTNEVSITLTPFVNNGLSLLTSQGEEYGINFTLLYITDLALGERVFAYPGDCIPISGDRYYAYTPTDGSSHNFLGTNTILHIVNGIIVEILPQTIPVQISITPTISITPSITKSISISPSINSSPTATPTLTVSTTKSISITPSITKSKSISPSVTKSISISPSPLTPFPYPTPSITPSITPSSGFTTFTIYANLASNTSPLQGWNSGTLACTSVGTPITVYIQGSGYSSFYDAVITKGKTIYLGDLITPYNGEYTYFYISSRDNFVIDPSGNVYNYSTCSSPAATVSPSKTVSPSMTPSKTTSITPSISKTPSISIAPSQTPGLPTFSNWGVLDITQTTIRLSLFLNGGTGPILERGYYFGTSPYPKDTGTRIVVDNINSAGYYATTLTGLTPNTNYYITGFAVNNIGEGTQISLQNQPIRTDL